MLPRKPKISYRYLKSGIEEFHRKYVLVLADKAANNVVVVWRLHYIDTLKLELRGTKAYEQTSEKEKSVIDNHIFMPRHKKWRGIMLYPPNFWVSVRPSVRPSVRQRLNIRVCSITLIPFEIISRNLAQI